MARRDPERERFWRELIEAKERSPLSVLAFCAEHGVSAPSFYAWRRRLRIRDEEPAFVPVTITGGTPIEVVHTSGATVRIGRGVELETLVTTLRALEQTSC